MGKFKQLDQERQESAMTKLKNWKKTDKFEVGLISPDRTKEFVKWLEENGHTLKDESSWMSINGIGLQEDTVVLDIFHFLIDDFKETIK